MTTPTLELNIKASGVTEVKALKAALAELNGEVGKLSAYKNVSGLDQIAQELKGLRGDVQAAMADLKNVISEGLKGTFQQASAQAQAGGEQVGDSFAKGLERSSVRVRVAAKSFSLGDGLTASVSGAGISSAEQVKKLANSLAQSAPALEAAADKLAQAQLLAKIKLMMSTSAFTLSQEEATDKEVASSLVRSLKLRTSTAAFVAAQQEAADKEAESSLLRSLKLRTSTTAYTTAQQEAADKEAESSLLRSIRLRVGTAAYVAAQEAAAEKEAAASLRAAKAETDAALAYAAAVAKADAIYKLASERSQTARAFTARTMLDTGVIAEQVTRQFGSLAVSAAQGASSSAALASGLEKVGHQITFNSRAFREGSTVIGEIAGNNFSRVRQSLFALANQMGILSGIFTATGATIAGVLAVAGVFITAVVKGEQETSAFKNALALTNDYLGLTKGQFDALAKSIATTTQTSIGGAKEALLDMAKTGKFTGDSLGVLAQDIVAQSRLTGESLESIVKDYARMPDGVHAWAVAHNDSMHFMSAAQLEHVRLLELQGEKQKALLIVGDALNKQFVSQAENLGTLEKVARGVKNTFSSMWDAMLGVGREQTIDEKIKDLEKKANNLAHQTYSGPLGSQGYGPMSANDAQKLENYRQQIADLRDARGMEQQIAATKALGLETQKLGEEGDKILEQMGVRISRAGKETEAIEQVTAAIKRHNAAWTGAGNSTDQGYNMLSGQGFISDAQKAQMLQFVHEKFNGGGGRGDNGLTALMKEEYKNQEAELTQHFDVEKALYAEQYKNKLVNQGQFALLSLTNNSQYLQALLIDYAKEYETIEADAKRRIAALPTNMGADARAKAVAAIKNQAQVLEDNDWAKVTKAFESVDTAEQKMVDDIYGGTNKLIAKNDEYWAKAEAGAKKETDLVNTRRQLAGATEEVRARAEAEGKANDKYSVSLQSVQTALDAAQASLNSFSVAWALSSAIEPLPPDAQALYDALKAKVDDLTAALDRYKSKAASLATEAGDSAVTALEDKKIQELRDNAKSLAKSTASAIVDGLLTGGSAGVQKLKDAVKQAFLSPIKVMLQAFIQPYVNQLVNAGYSAIGLNNATSTGSGANYLQAGSNYLSSSGSSWSMSNVGTMGQGPGAFFGFSPAQAVTSSGVATSSVFNAAQDSQLANSAGLASSGASAVSSYMPYVGALVAASQKQYGQAAGMAIGTMIMPGIGTVIGAVIGSIIDSMSKKHGPKDEGFYNYDNAPVPNTEATGAKQIADAIDSSYATLATQLGISNASLNAGVFFSKDPNGTAQTQLDVKTANYSRGTLYGTTENAGRTDTEFSDAVTQATEQAIITGLLSSDLDQKFKDYLSAVDLKSSGAVLSQKIMDVLNVKRLTDILKELGSSFGGIKDASMETITALIDTGGGFDALSSKMSSFYNNYYTDQQKLGILQQSLSEQFAKLGITMPKTRDEFKKLVLAQDLTTTAGQTTFNALLNLSDAFAQLTQNTTDLTSVTQTQAQLDQAATDARSKLQTAYNSESDRLTTLSDHMQSFVKDMGTFLKELTTGDLAGLTPQQQYAAAKADFAKYTQELSSSDPTLRDDALTNIADAGKALLEASRAMNGASDGYYSDLTDVTSAVQEAKDIAQSGVDVATTQLQALDKMVEGLVDLRAADSSSLTAIYNVTGSGLAAVVSAVGTLQAAILGAAAGPTPSADTTTSAQTLLTSGNLTGDVVASAVTSYYQQYLGRQPEAGGLAYWTNLYTSGVSLADIQNDIKTSPESVTYNGGVPLRSGLDRVPYDGFPATLHKDEAVLNAAEADKRRRQSVDQDALISKLEARLASLENTVEAGLHEVVSAQYVSSDHAATKIAASHKEAAESKGWNGRVRDGGRLR